MSKQKVTFGIFSDLHYANEDDGDRLKSLSLQKLTNAIDFFTKSNVDFIINLGDTIDLAESIDAERKLCKEINDTVSTINVPVYHVIGNHDVAMFDKQEFLHEINMQNAYYSFTCKGLNFTILDGNCHEDGSDFSKNNFSWDEAWISKKQLDWLKNDLLINKEPTIIFCHERLDGYIYDPIHNPHVIQNYLDVNVIIEKSDNIIAVFSGHEHTGNISYIDSIPYITCPAMVVGETPAYAIVKIFDDNSIAISGVGRFPSIK
jgi:alkaline phosphatase